MNITITNTDLRAYNLFTRMRFKYGIATLTAVPQAFVGVELEVDGKRGWGVAADVLPPKWFKKDPDQAFADELSEMIGAINHADQRVQGRQGSRVFELWRELYDEQYAWGQAQGLPPLLANFGLTFFERAMIDAFCRITGSSFAEAVRQNTLGIDPGQVHGELGDSAGTLNDALADKALTDMALRHTVGLGDPLTEADLTDEIRLDDGLPQTLEQCIDTYGLTHLKIKLCGDPQRDLDRLKQIAGLGRFQFTLDGNENFHEVEPFRQLWDAIYHAPELGAFMQGLLFVEQPFHRAIALDDDFGQALRDWADRPPIIIDESDGELASLPQALDRGYIGASHKNCKGVFKSLANAALLAHRRKQSPAHADRPLTLSAEDLTNTGPVALPQDLAVAATLGITHIERNGHHYYAGLSMYPKPVQQAMTEHHGDLYRRHELGFPTMAIDHGHIQLQTTVNAPFGCALPIEALGLAEMTLLNDWHLDSLNENR